MLNIPSLANDIKYDKVCYVYIFQNTHIVAYDEIHMHTPPKKVFIQAWRKLTQMANAKPGVNVNKETGTQNITKRK